MKKHDKIMLCTMIVAVLVLSFSSLPSSYTEETQTHIAAQPEPELISAETTDNYLHESFQTKNGYTLTVNKIYNNENTTLAVDTIRFKGTDVPVNKEIPPNSSWNYVELDGILIIPDGLVSFDTYETSYYPNSKQFFAVFSYSEAYGMEIHIKSKGKPSVIKTNTDFSWNFDVSTGILKMISNRDPIEYIQMFFVDFEPKGTVFLEDTRNLEETSLQIADTQSQLLIFKDTEEKLTNEKNEKQGTVDKLEDQLNNKRGIRLEIQDDIKNSNTTIDELQNEITNNIVLSPMLALGWVIVFIVIIILLVEIFLFRPKGEEIAKK